MAKKTTTKEKKPTAAQIAREKRQQFIARCYALALSKLAETTTYSRHKAKVTLTHTNGNRYIRMNRFGMSLVILFYRDGNADFILKEDFHADYQQQVFLYTEDEAEQEKFLDWLSHVLDWLLILFMDEYGLDFHTFMDFVSGEKDLERARDCMLEYVHLSEEAYLDAARHC